MQHYKLWACLVWSIKFWNLFFFLSVGIVNLVSHNLQAQSSDCLTPENLALNQSTEQSSTYGLGVSSLAVDGNRIGSSPWSANLQHTDNEDQPWWQVDLGQPSDLESMTIFNRTNAFQSRLSNFYIFVSSSPISRSSSLDELLANGTVTNFYFPSPAGVVVDLPLGIQGQYIRIQLEAQGVLHLSEVEINGCAKDDPCDEAIPVNIESAGPFLESQEIQALSASPPGGTWGGAVASDGTFDPSMGQGAYVVSYTYTDSLGCTPLDSIEIPVIPLGVCSIPTNMALNQPATQSTTLGNGRANLAVDGERSGTSPWAGDLQHTEEEENPWWEVELSSFSQIDQVIVFNRSDCCQSRLNDFYVLVSASPFNPEASLSELLNNLNISQTFFSGAAGSLEILPIDATGRYVRIQLAGTGTLHLREVEVIGCAGGTDPCQDAQPVQISPVTSLLADSDIQTLSATPPGGVWGGTASSNGTFDPSIGPGTYTVTYSYTDENGCFQTASENIPVVPAGSDCLSPNNLALGQAAEQSSTYGLGIAAVAVDSNTNGSGGPWENAEIIHTQREDQPWWQVDLTSQSEIHEVLLYNRTDCCQDRLSDFYVFYSDEAFPPDASLTDLLGAESASNNFFEGPVGEFVRVPIYGEGRHVRIQLTGSNEILHLAEVEIWGCKVTSEETGTGNQFEGVGESLEGPAEENEPSLVIFPNPIDSNGELSVQVKLPNPGTFQVSLYDYQGKAAYRSIQELSREENIILLVNSLSKGLYLVEVLGGDVHLTKQFLVK